MTERTENKNKAKYPQRVRNELRFREITVLHSDMIAPGFRRVIFGGDALSGFESKGFDDHVKTFFPQPGTGFTPPKVTDEGIVWQSDVRPPSRDYTPIFNAERNELTLDFYMHDSGVASDWAAQSKPGDKIFIGGPRGSLVVPVDYARQIYVCDETGMPALLRRLEELKAKAVNAEITAIVAIADESHKAYLAHLSEFNIEWVICADPSVITHRLRTLTIPEQDYFIWITGEGKEVKTWSNVFETPSIDPELLRAVAYWHKKAENA